MVADMMLCLAPLQRYRYFDRDARASDPTRDEEEWQALLAFEEAGVLQFGDACIKGGQNMVKLRPHGEERSRMKLCCQEALLHPRFLMLLSHTPFAHGRSSFSQTGIVAQSVHISCLYSLSPHETT